MNYYGAKELAASLRTVRGNTIKAAEDIPEEKYAFSPAPEWRTVGQLLTHIALGHRFQQAIHTEARGGLEGFDFPGLFAKVMAEEQQPRTKAQIIELLKTEGEAWANWIEGLSESFL